MIQGYYKTKQTMFKKLWGSSEKGEDTNKSASSWENLTSVEQIQSLIENSNQQAVLIFKHSTRCSISSMAFSRMQSGAQSLSDEGIQLVFLDLIKYRDVSNAVASTFEITHQSPQVLLIQNGTCTYDTSHTAIDPKVILSSI